MPNRVFRDGLLTSHAWNHLDIETRELYVRLILCADDFGCFDGREEVIAARACPTFVFPQFEDHTIAQMLIELHRAGLIIRYSNAGKPYIAIMQWTSDYRSVRKFPAPPLDNELPRPGAKPLRGAYGKDIVWQNPHGTDPVSVLLDVDGRAAVPQPQEWRPPSHYMAVTGKRSDKQVNTASSDYPAVTVGDTSDYRSGTVRQELEVEVGLVKEVGVGVGESEKAVTAPQSLQHPTPTNGGIIEYRQGRFVGLSEEQRVKWQAMFDELRIPDQIDRAAAWLEVHDDERGAIEKQGLGFAQFIVRWLLREVRSPHTGAGS